MRQFVLLLATTCVFTVTLTEIAQSQVSITWKSNTNGNPNYWSDTNNWFGSVVPGSISNVTNNNIAAFDENTSNTNVGIDFGGLGGTTLALGRIDFDTNLDKRNASLELNSVGASGTIRLNGVTESSTKIFLIQGSQNHNMTIGDGTGSLAVQLGATRGIIGVTNAQRSLTINSVISESSSGSGFTKAGQGTLVLGANNTYSGSTSFSDQGTAGTIQIGTGGATGSLGTGGVSMTNSSALLFNRSDTYSFNNVVTGGGNITQSNSGAKATFSNLSNTGTFSNTSGYSIISGASNFSGTTISGGTLEITGSIGNGAVTMSNNSQLIFNKSGTFGFANAVSGSGNVTQSNAGAVATFGNLNNTGTFTNTAGKSIISGTSNFTQTTISGGTVEIAGSIGSNAIVMSNGSELILNKSGTFNFTNAVSGNGNVTQSNALANVTFSNLGNVGSFTNSAGQSTITGTNNLTLVTISGGSLSTSALSDSTHVDVTGGTYVLTSSDAIDRLTGDANVSLGNNNLTVGASNGNAEFTGSISGPGGLVKAGSGTQILSGLNIFGATTISGGTLQIGNGDTSGTLGSGNVTNNASLVFNRSDAITVTNGISGTGSLTQLGTGTTTLSNTVNINGSTTVSHGALAVNQSLTSSSVIVESSGMLQGSGTVISAVGVSGNLAPGNSIGQLDIVGSLSMNSGSTITIEYDDSANNVFNLKNDLLNITGNINIESGVTLDLKQFIPGTSVHPNTWYEFLTYTGTWNGTKFAYVTGSSPANTHWIVDYNYNGGKSFAFSAVPEPGSFALIGIASMIGGMRVWRRRNENLIKKDE